MSSRNRWRRADVALVLLALRGNFGRVGGMVMGFGGHFLDEPVDLGTLRTRETRLRLAVNPQRDEPVTVTRRDLLRDRDPVLEAVLR